MKVGDLVQTIVPLPNLGLDDGEFGICIEIKEYHESREDRGRGYFYFSNSRFHHRGATERSDAGLNLLLFDRLKVVDSDDIPLSIEDLKDKLS
jgi:hypothetical protein